MHKKNQIGVALVFLASYLLTASAENSGLKSRCPADDSNEHSRCVAKEVNASRARLAATLADISKRVQPSESALLMRDQRRWDLTAHRSCRREADHDCPTRDCPPVGSLSKAELDLKRDSPGWETVYSYCIDAKFNERDRQLRLQHELR